MCEQNLEAQVIMLYCVYVTMETADESEGHGFESLILGVLHSVKKIPSALELRTQLLALKRVVLVLAPRVRLGLVDIKRFG